MMNMDTAGDIMASGIHLVLLISAVAIIPSLLVGLCVSIFQATTQINEQTLTQLVDFTVQIFHQAAALVG